MAILTSKGARAPHQLKGRRNVRISRDRRGCGNDDIEQLKDEVNNALADCQKKYYIEGLKDANLATSSGIMNSYHVNFNCANIPIARIGVLTVYGYVSGQYSRTTQEYVTNDDSVTTGEKYIRYGMSNDYGTSWTWSDWEKLVTESDLNGALEQCQKFKMAPTRDGQLKYIRIKYTANDEPALLISFKGFTTILLNLAYYVILLKESGNYIYGFKSGYNYNNSIYICYNGWRVPRVLNIAGDKCEIETITKDEYDVAETNGNRIESMQFN